MKRFMGVILLMALLGALLCGCSSEKTGVKGLMIGNGGSIKVPADPDTLGYSDLLEDTVADVMDPVPETTEKPTVQPAEPVQTPAENGGKILQTKYFNIVMPNSWVGRYYAEVPAEGWYDSYSGEFEYVITLYEKQGYYNRGPGRLLEIVLTTDENYQSYANGGIFGYMDSEPRYYFCARYPTDIQWSSETREVHAEMEKDIPKVLNGIYSETCSVNTYAQEEPYWDDDDFLLPYSSDRLLTEADIEALMNNTYRESPTGSYVQDAINEIYARNGYVFQSEKLYRYYAWQNWYRPDSNFSMDSFSQIEKENIALLQTYLG